MLSWLLELFLSSIPSWAWLVGAIGGLVVFLFSGVLSMLPVIGAYIKLIKPIAGIVTLLCAFLYGGAGVQAIWEEKVRIAQELADKKAAQAEQLNKDLAAERTKKQKVRVEYYNTVKTEIREVEKLIDAKCEIDPKVPEILNKAAKNPEGAK